MEIWNHHIVRIGGLNFDLLDDLCLTRSIELIKEYVNLEAEIANQYEHLSSHLFHLVKLAGEDKHMSRRCLNLRRDIFNNRPIKIKNLEPINILLSESLSIRLHELVAKHVRIGEINDELGLALKIEKGAIRKSLKKILRIEEFKSGLLLGSSTLFDSLAPYLLAEPQEVKRWEGEELGFVRYLTRTLAKTSPFSTFTSIGTMSQFDKKSTTSKVIKPVRRSLIRLNNRILKAFMDLLHQYYPFYCHIRVRLNYTIYNDANKYTFILNTSNNNEAFQEISKQPILEYIYEILSQRNYMTYDRLIKGLGKVTSASPDDLRAFVNSLLSFGFLEYEPEVTSSDPDWCGTLIRVIKKKNEKNDDIILKKLIDGFEIINVQYSCYETLGSSDRLVLLDSILQIIYQIYFELHKAVGLPEEQRTAMMQFRSNIKISVDAPNLTATEANENSGKQKILQTVLLIDRRAILFEDTSSPEQLNIDRQNILKTVETLNRFNQQLYFANIYEDSREEIKNFFREKYSEDGRVSSLTFYRAYSENKVNKKINTLPVANHDLRYRWMESFSRHIERREMTDNVAHIHLDDIIKVNEELDIKEDIGIKRSYSAFFQTANLKKNSQHLSVMNGVLVGYGKYASRFLPLFDSKLTTYFRDKNRELMKDAIFAEHNGISYFNANIHPPLLEKELITTGNHPVMKSGNFIKIQDVDICYSKLDNELYLKDKATEKKIVMFDLGFQAPSTRSAFFNFLSSFTQSTVPDYSLIISCVYDVYEKRTLAGKEWVDEFIVYPRVCIADNIVLARRRWRIHPNRFPTFSKTDDFCSKLKTVWTWKEKYAMPEEFFMGFAPGIVNEVKLSKNDDKPQYINLTNPFLVSIFIKMLSKGTTLTIEEMLPTSDSLQNTPDERRFVSEILVHWSS